MTTRVRQSADTVDIAVETIITQTNPYTPLRIRAKSPKRRPSLANIRRNFSSLFGRSPSPVVDPSANKCHHCHIVGHWSNDCPLWCTICALRKGKEPRGHEAKNCRPTCTNCNGIGSVKRTIGDERTSETLELLVALASIKTVVHNFRDEHAGIQGTRDSGKFMAHRCTRLTTDKPRPP
jgi:hypothetical protein